MDFFIHNAISSLGINKNNKIIAINKNALAKYPLLAQSMIIKIISNNKDKKWRKHHWKELDLFLQSHKTGALLSFPNNYQILNDRDEWKIREINTSLGDECDISIGNTFENELFSIQLKETKAISFISNPSSIETIDANTIAGKKLKVRPWTPSDHFQPLGMNGTQKLSDYFINQKMDRFEKDQQYVLTADNEIIWICGKKISHKVRIRSTTMEAINLKFHWK
jgi:tRNA(Ile)-lysidine synthase